MSAAGFANSVFKSLKLAPNLFTAKRKLSDASEPAASGAAYSRLSVEQIGPIWAPNLHPYRPTLSLAGFRPSSGPIFPLLCRRLAAESGPQTRG